MSLKAKHGYGISTWLQGSSKYGTLIKPVRADDEYDVDLGVYFDWGNGENIEPTADQLRRWVQRELVNYRDQCADMRSVVEPPKERCSRASYEHQFHIDTPVYHLNGDTDKRRLAYLTKGWEAGDPKAFHKRFRDANHHNQVAGVAKGCTLVFTIANPHVVPTFATVEWTVRNKGLEADESSDLGHRRVGMRMLQAEELTRYLGTQNMDCIVRVNGQVYAARRVPVTIRDVQHHVHNPALPAYTRLRIKRRR